MGTVRLADIGPPRTPTQYPGSRSRQREEFESRSEVAEHIGQCSGTRHKRKESADRILEPASRSGRSGCRGPPVANELPLRQVVRQDE
jgi:hypothetical protein